MKSKHFTKLTIILALVIAQLGLSSFGFLEPIGLMKVERKSTATPSDSLIRLSEGNQLAVLAEGSVEKGKVNMPNSAWTSQLAQKAHLYLKSFLNKLCFVCVKCAQVVVVVMINFLVK